MSQLENTTTTTTRKRGEEAMKKAMSFLMILVAAITLTGCQPQDPENQQIPEGMGRVRIAGNIFDGAKENVDWQPIVNFLQEKVTDLRVSFSIQNEEGRLEYVQQLDVAIIDENGNFDAVSDPLPLEVNYLEMRATRFNCQPFFRGEAEFELEPASTTVVGVNLALVRTFDYMFRVEGFESIDFPRSNFNHVIGAMYQNDVAVSEVRITPFEGENVFWVYAPIQISPDDNYYMIVEDKTGAAYGTYLRFSVHDLFDPIDPYPCWVEAGDFHLLPYEPVEEFGQVEFTITFGPPFAVGELLINTSVRSPEANILPGNTSGITVLTLSLQSTIEPIQVKSLPIYIGKINDGGPDQVSRVDAYSGATLIGSAIPTTTDDWPGDPIPLTGSGHQLEFFEPLIVEPGAEKIITIKVDTPNCREWLDGAGAGICRSGQGFTIEIPGNELFGTGSMSGRTIAGNGHASSSGFILYASMPTIGTNSQTNYWPGNSGNLIPGRSQHNLYIIEILADPAGDIGIGELTYVLSATYGLEISNLRLKKLLGGEIVASGYEDVVVEGSEVRHADIVFDFEKPLTIPAGTTQALILTADINVPPSPGEFIQVSLKGDVDWYRGAFAEVAWPGTFVSPAFIAWTDYALSGPLGSSDPAVWNEPQWYSGDLMHNFQGNYLAWEVDWVTFAN
ncbi:hypothetical protein HYZ76_00515 [Candidatus Falkowbacteria bacterium]|nr:hypothetical protein [Candidatus Falkowbacteria bacterium]